MQNVKHLHGKSIVRPNSLPILQAESSAKDFKILLLLTALHLPLGLVLYRTGSLGLLHPLAAFGLGMYWAVRRQTKIEYVAYVLAYIVGVEVLWRMASVPIFYEFGKYSITLIMATALIRRRLYKFPALPPIYFAALIPSCFLTLLAFSLSEARAALSFNMSGPLALCAACLFFSNAQLTILHIKRLLSVIIVPLVCVACTTLFYTVTAPVIEFTTESNLATSGGFGPNQVSSLLGLGAFCALVSLLLFKNDTKYKLYFGAAALFLSAQSVMTFSRGGMYSAIGAVLIVVLLQFQNLAEGLKRFVPILLIAGLFFVFIFPVMNDFTGGKLSERFEETQGTNRTELVESDVQVFLENPVLGVGVAVSGQYRAEIMGSRGAASHTEFSRLLSEHGSFGLLSLLALAATIITNLKRQRSRFGRALVGGLVVWTILYMMGAGMRLAAPSFIFGLSFVTLIRFRMKSRKAITANRASRFEKRRLIRSGIDRN